MLTCAGQVTAGFEAAGMGLRLLPAATPGRLVTSHLVQDSTIRCLSSKIVPMAFWR